MPAKTIYVTDADTGLWAAFTAQAETELLSVSQLLAKAIRAYLDAVACPNC